MEVNDQLHAPGWYPLDKRSWRQSQSASCGENKTTCPCSESNADSSVIKSAYRLSDPSPMESSLRKNGADARLTGPENKWCMKQVVTSPRNSAARCMYFNAYSTGADYVNTKTSQNGNIITSILSSRRITHSHTFAILDCFIGILTGGRHENLTTEELGRHKWSY
jgi:hypothetical protein